MILFQLRCGKDHHFEAWFRDNAAYDDQAAAGVITCPQCGDAHVEKAIMAPRLNKKAGAALDVAETVREAKRLLGEMRREIEAKCDYVGDRFSEEARKIHYGETAARPIYGEATGEQARDLAEEGVAFAQIPWINSEN